MTEKQGCSLFSRLQQRKSAGVMTWNPLPSNPFQKKTFSMFWMGTNSRAVEASGRVKMVDSSTIIVQPVFIRGGSYLEFIKLPALLGQCTMESFFKSIFSSYMIRKVLATRSTLGSFWVVLFLFSGNNLSHFYLNSPPLLFSSANITYHLQIRLNVINTAARSQ